MLALNKGKSKAKEASETKLLPLPDAVQYKAWKFNTRAKVVAASGRSDSA